MAAHNSGQSGQRVARNGRKAVKSATESACVCDDEWVRFTRTHCVSHDECRQSKWRCDLCAEVKADLNAILAHICAEKHRQIHAKLMGHLFVTSLPEPIECHTNALTDLLVENYDSNAVTDQHLRSRVEVVDRFNHFLAANGQHCATRLHGSSINGFGLKSSNVNIELILANRPASSETERTDASRLTALAKVSELIAADKRLFSIIRNEYNFKVPKVYFMDRESELTVELSINGEKSYRTSKLLRTYSMLDKRVAVLGVALRRWAHISEFDDQPNGKWPSIAFPVLVIHYLQRCVPPVLPCLHEMFANEWSSKSSDNELNDEELLEFLESSEIDWRTANTTSVGQLWLDMLKYYTVGLDLEAFVVSIRHKKNLETRRQKGWPSSRVLAIENPIQWKHNLSRSVVCDDIYNAFLDSLRDTYKYFAMPFIVSLPADPNSRAKPLYVEQDFEVIIDETNAYNSDNFKHDLNGKNSRYLNDDRHTNGKKDSDESDDNQVINEKHESEFSKIRRLSRLYGIRVALKRDVERKIDGILKEQLMHTFDLKSLPFFANRETPKYCRVCRRVGHQQNACPDQRLPDLVELPPKMDELHKKVLDDICAEIFDKQRMTDAEESQYSLVMNDLQAFLGARMPFARLELFGSTMNGFGTRNSDLDISLTFENNETGVGLDKSDIIERVGLIFRIHPRVTRISLITQAKVPIVKFAYVLDGPKNTIIACDISLFNIQARYNTLLVKAYCSIDSRVQMLGFVVKHFAKTCDICDASQGTLSSYAYILLTLHFMQQKGIIPCLQEIGLQRKTDRLIDGWNTWFFDDLSALSDLWKCEPNGQSVGELFLDFLIYYTEKFNFDENVVCCRQSAPLRRIEKMWTRGRIAIEDPFKLSHNLGDGVRNRRANIIKAAFIKARNRIGCPPPSLPANYTNWLEYLFDKQLLTRVTLPTD